MDKLSRLVKSLVCVCSTTALLGCAALQNQGSGQPVDDPTITARVQAAISNDPSLRKFTISVQTVKGEVVLRGRVETQQDVTKAAEVVHSVKGVVSLYNDLTIN